MESALVAREDDPVWKKVVTTLRAEDIYDMSEKFDNRVSDYTGEDEEEALLSMYKEVDKCQNKVEVERMKVKEAKDILELIRDNIEMPIPKVTRTGLAITALTGGIDALESVDALKKKFIDGMNVHRQGDDADDGIECPFCGYEVARNDDYQEMRPKHCPECGTKLIY